MREAKRGHVRSKTPVTWGTSTQDIKDPLLIPLWLADFIDSSASEASRTLYCTSINLNYGQRWLCLCTCDHWLFPPLLNQWFCRDSFISLRSSGWSLKRTRITSQWWGQGASCWCTRRKLPPEECAPDPSSPSFSPFTQDNITHSPEHRKSIHLS